MRGQLKRRRAGVGLLCVDNASSEVVGLLCVDSYGTSPSTWPPIDRPVMRTGAPAGTGTSVVGLLCVDKSSFSKRHQTSSLDRMTGERRRVEGIRRGQTVFAVAGGPSLCHHRPVMRNTASPATRAPRGWIHCSGCPSG